MALDETKENDEVVTDESSGVIVVADKELLKETGTISIDFTGLGFNIQSENPLEERGSGCAGCGSSGSCGD